MSDIYKILNKTKNVQEFKEVKLCDSEKENIFNRVNNKIKKKRKPYKRLAACLMCVVLLGAVGTETGVLAAINESIGNSISRMLGDDINENGSLDFNKKEILQEGESNGIKVTTYDAVIEDNEVLVSATLDYSNFDKNEYNIADNKDYYIDHYRHGYYSDGSGVAYELFDFTVTQNGIEKEVERGAIVSDYKDNKEEKTIDLLFATKILDYDSGKDCEINLKSKGLTARVKKDGLLLFEKNKYDYIDVDFDLEFNFKIDSKGKGIDDVKTYEINNNLEIPYKGEKLKYNLKSVKISPLLIQIHHDVDFYKGYDIGVTGYKVYDQNGKLLECTGGYGNDETGVFASYLNNGKITSIKVVPYLGLNDTILGIDIYRKKEYKDKAVVIDIN